MKQIKSYLILSLIIGVVFTSCKKDDPVVQGTVTIESIVSGGTDLYGAISATEVSTTDNIVITLSAAVDASTATNANITIERNGIDVPLSITVSGSAITIDPTDDLLSGADCTLSIENVKSSNGGTVSSTLVSFTTAGVGLDTPPQEDAQVLYISFDGSIVDLTGNATNTFEQISYSTDRFGKSGSAVKFDGEAAAGTGDIVELSGGTFISPSTTISVWFKANSADYVAGSRFMFGLCTERGYFMEVGGDLAWTKLATSHAIIPDPNSHYFGTAWTDPNGDGSVGGQVLYDYMGSIKDLIGDNGWAQLVMTFDASTSTKTIYFNGQKAMQADLDFETTEWYLKDMAIADKADGTGDPITGIDQTLSLGYSCSRANSATGWSIYSTATNTFKGEMDDFRIFNKALTESEVSELYNSEN